MRAVTAAMMREMDRRTIEERGVAGVLLMERAGAGATRVALELLGEPGKRVLLLCGKGNNGGDGFVIARLLAEAGHRPRVLCSFDPGEVRGDAALALEALRAAGGVVERPTAEALPPALLEADLVVDALLGTGLSGPVAEPLAAWIRATNAARRPVLAVDLPSGLCADRGVVLGVAIEAAVTVTFALPKLGLLHHPGAAHAGRVVCVDIGIPPDLVDEGAAELLEPARVAAMLPPRSPEAHKGDAGRVLLVAGSTGLTGAACLAARGCCRGGAGLVTVAVPSSVCASVETRLLEAMTWPLACCPAWLDRASVPALLERAAGCDALAVGPGLGRMADTLAAVRDLLDDAPCPVVVDADGLLALPEWSPGESPRPATVLTPHPGEMAVLLDCTVAAVQADRAEAARTAAVRYRAAVVLKGARSVVAAPDGRVAINPTGHPGMASGGMGDVLTGLVAALLGQGLGAYEAACAGAYLHGWAAALAAERLGGEIGILAADVADSLPRARSTITRGAGPASPVERRPMPEAAPVR